MTKELTCICCPMGCSLTAELKNGEVTSVSGNTCKRGEIYAKSELTAPVRVVTTTMMADNGKPVPVKTAEPIPKEKIFDCVDQIKAATAVLPVKMGDVLIKGVAGTDSDIVAARSMK